MHSTIPKNDIQDCRFTICVLKKSSITCKMLGIENGKRVYKNIPLASLGRGIDEMQQCKIFISKADGAAGQIGYPIPARIIGKAEICGPNTACTETFLRVGPFADEQTANNVKTYMETKFFRALVGVRKNKNMINFIFHIILKIQRKILKSTGLS